MIYVNTMKKTLWITALIILALGGLWYSKSQPVPATGEPIKIGGIFALTGLGASQGIQEFRGAQLAIDQINAKGGIDGRPLKLVPEDVSLDKINVAASAASKLINVDKVTAIVGTTWDEPAQVILPIIEKAKVPMVGQNQTRMLKNNEAFSYFFSTWYNNEVGIKELLSYAEANKIKKVAIIRPIGAGFYQYVSDKVKANAPNYGVTIVEDINLNDPTVGDFRTPLTLIKAKKPDAVIMVVNNFTECTVLRQMKELQLNIPVLSTEAAGDFSTLAQCPDLMENIYFSYPKETSKYKSFVGAYSGEFKTVPETPSALTAYDAVMVIAVGLEKTKGVGGESLQRALTRTNNFPGVSLERISFDRMGYVFTPDDAFEMRTVRKGEFVKI